MTFIKIRYFLAGFELNMDWSEVGHTINLTVSSLALWEARGAQRWLPSLSSILQTSFEPTHSIQGSPLVQIWKVDFSDEGKGFIFNFSKLKFLYWGGFRPGKILVDKFRH